MLVILTHPLGLSKRHFLRKPRVKSERNDRFQPEKVLKVIEHVAVHSNIAKCHCRYVEEAVARQTPDFLNHRVLCFVYQHFCICDVIKCLNLLLLLLLLLLLSLLLLLLLLSSSLLLSIYFKLATYIAM